MFIPGSIYNRRHLHETYAGQRQGGISTPAGQPLIFLFTGEAGHQYGYRDRWTDEGLFLYTGEGQSGDMAFLRGNRAVRDHIADGKDLHLFEYERKGYARYVGQMICTGYHQLQGPDVDGRTRSIIAFELARIETFAPTPGLETPLQPDHQSSLAALCQRALAATTHAATPKERLTQAYERSEAARDYVLARAGAHCEACGTPAPFQTASGRPYLETHHIRRLSDAGPDHPRWVAAVCPNCHSRAHHSHDKVDFNKRLAEFVEQRETSLSDHSKYARDPYEMMGSRP